MNFEEFLKANGFDHEGLSAFWRLNIGDETSITVTKTWMNIRASGEYDAVLFSERERTTDAEDREVVNRLIVALRMLAGQSPWLPMETAPRDGTDVMLLVDGDIIPRVSWCDQFDRWEERDTADTPGLIAIDDNPTGWMPLPETMEEEGVMRP